jgi:hypothetical protein
MASAVRARFADDKVGGKCRSVSMRTTAISIVRGGAVKGWKRGRTMTLSPSELERAREAGDSGFRGIDEGEILAPFPHHRIMRGRRPSRSSRAERFAKVSEAIAPSATIAINILTAI